MKVPQFHPDRPALRPWQTRGAAGRCGTGRPGSCEGRGSRADERAAALQSLRLESAGLVPDRPLRPRYRDFRRRSADRPRLAPAAGSCRPNHPQDLRRCPARGGRPRRCTHSHPVARSRPVRCVAGRAAPVKPPCRASPRIAFKGAALHLPAGTKGSRSTAWSLNGTAKSLNETAQKLSGVAKSLNGAAQKLSGIAKSLKWSSSEAIRSSKKPQRTSKKP